MVRNPWPMQGQPCPATLETLIIMNTYEYYYDNGYDCSNNHYYKAYSHMGASRMLKLL